MFQDHFKQGGSVNCVDKCEVMSCCCYLQLSKLIPLRAIRPEITEMADFSGEKILDYGQR